MGFEKFGVINHVPEVKVNDIVTYLEKGEVRGTRCKKCGADYFPPRADCARCRTSDMDWVEIKGTGKLMTYSTVYYGPAGFEDKAPYWLGVGDFGGLKMLGFLSKELVKDVKVGMPVKIAALKLPEDKVAFEFIPA